MPAQLLGLPTGHPSGLPFLLNDDILLRLGNDSDQVLVNRSTTLAADTALTSVLIGTVVGEALAANSLIISNTTAGGDVALYANRGGNSEMYLLAEGASGTLWLFGYAGGIMLGLAANPPAPDLGAVHIWDSSAGVVTADTGTLLTLESSSGTVWLSLLGTNTGVTGILLGQAANNAQHSIVGRASSAAVRPNSIDFTIGGAQRGNWAANAFAFQEATTISTTAGALTLSPTTITTTAVRIAALAGVNIGADAANNLIDDATGGTGSTQLFIGNASINVTSDMRVKYDIESYLGSALALFHRIPVVEYGMDERYKPFGGVYMGRYVGITAQKLYETVPWAVNTQGGKDCWECRAGLPCELHLPWQVRYELMAGLFVKGFQEVDDELTSLKRQVAALNDRILVLEKGI